MKLSDILLEKFIDSELFEMADEAKRARRKINGQVKTMVLHLVAVQVFKAPLLIQHWKKEIEDSLQIIADQKLKGNKKPSKDQLSKWIFTDGIEIHVEQIPGYVKLLQKREKAPLREYNDINVFNNIIDLINQVIYYIASRNKRELIVIELNEFSTFKKILKEIQ